jgi:hypothetical protein
MLRCATLSSSAHPFTAGWHALRRFAKPFFLAQATALAFGAAYFLSPRVQAACSALARWKVAGGVTFAMVACAVAGGLLPELFKWLVSPRRYVWQPRLVAFNTAFFAVNGWVIDAFYRFLGWLFGNDASVATVAAKVAFDQFVFTPSWLAVVTFLYLWERKGFRWHATVAAARPHFYRQRVLPLLLPDWCFWIPMVSVIYALPANLQFMMFSLALAAWSLVMVYIARGEDVATPAIPAIPAAS